MASTPFTPLRRIWVPHPSLLRVRFLTLLSLSCRRPHLFPDNPYPLELIPPPSRNSTSCSTAILLREQQVSAIRNSRACTPAVHSTSDFFALCHFPHPPFTQNYLDTLYPAPVITSPILPIDRRAFRKLNVSHVPPLSPKRPVAPNSEVPCARAMLRREQL